MELRTSVYGKPVLFFVALAVFIFGGSYVLTRRIVIFVRDAAPSIQPGATVASSLRDSFLEAGGGTVTLNTDAEAAIIPSILAPPAVTVPVRDETIAPPALTAESAYVIDGQTETILFAYNEQSRRPVASLTKLATAYVAAKYLPPAATIPITQQVVATEGNAGDLVAGEELYFYDALAALLIPSSNDAAEALAQYLGRERFIALMNQEMAVVGIDDARFETPSGLDAPGQYGTAQSIVNIFRIVFGIEPIQKLLSSPMYETRSVDGAVYHRFLSSNALLGAYPGVLAGKTGFTDEAGQALVVAWRPPAKSIIERQNSAPIVFAAVLGSRDRFGDMRLLLDWLAEAYHW